VTNETPPQPDSSLHAAAHVRTVVTATLQTEITELVAFPYKPDTAEWVRKVQDARTEVIAGAIATWVPSGGSQIGATIWAPNANDFLAPRREAALAILHARFAAESGRQTKWLLYLTWAIVGLTIAMVLVAGWQVWLTFHPPAPPLNY
jgi:hypothetical protein